MKKLILFSVLLLTAALLEAQETSATLKKDPLPPGPLLLTDLGNFAQWIVTVTVVKPPAAAGDEAAATKPAPVLQTITFTKTKPILRVQIVSGETIAEDRWIIGAAQVVTAPSMRFPYISHPSPETPDVSYDKTDFPDWAWISANKYMGTKQDPLSGRKVIVFQDTLKLTDPDGLATNKGVTACVDFESRLPVSLQEDSTLKTYQIKTPPTTLQTVPPEVQNALDTEAKNNAIINRPPGTPAMRRPDTSG